jgi:HEAT repeat protein
LDLPKDYSLDSSDRSLPFILESGEPESQDAAIEGDGINSDTSPLETDSNRHSDTGCNIPETTNQYSLILASLSEIGIRTLKPMNNAWSISLQNENPEVRKNAIRDLTRIYELVNQISYLLHRATDDPDPEVQETARWAINQLNRIRPRSGID